MTIVYFLVTAFSVLPIAAAYLSAKHHFAFKRRSFGQLFAVTVAVFVVLGTFLAQSAVLEAFTVSMPDAYFQKLVALQYSVAVAVFWWKLVRTHRQLTSTHS
jgi:uncharacterized membrane protein YcaP (DUF421 family)